MKFNYKKLVAAVVVATGVLASAVFATHSNAAYWSGQDCSGNAIIKCGVSSPSALRTKYNASSELQALYGHFGVNSAMINSPMKQGVVTNSGNVIVDGKTVATNAMSVGRWQDDGSGCKGSPFTVAGHTYYQGNTACRFGAKGGYEGQVAYVMLKSDGSFGGAILVACGNIVPAKPVPPAPKPQPTYACNSLTATAEAQADKSVLKFNFAAKGSAANGAHIVSYTYNFGDGQSVTAGATTSHTYTQTGTYTATVTANVSVNGKVVPVTSSACKTTVKPYKNVVKPADVTCTGLTLGIASTAGKAPVYYLSATASATAGVPYVQQAGAISGYTFTIKDANGATVKTINQKTTAQKASSGNFSLNPGAYTAQVVVHSNVGDKTGSQCTVKINVPKPNQIQVCRLSDYQIVAINENDFDSSKYSKNLSDCEKVTVCDTTTSTVVTVTKTQAEDSRYTTDMSKCQPAPVVPTTPQTPSQPTSTPVELPHTGTSDVALNLVGAGSLVAAISYYVASRRALNA